MADVKKKKSVIADFRALDVSALQTKVAELKQQLAEHYRSLAAGELANPSVIRKIRKDIAKALTIANEKARAAKEIK